MKVTVTISEDRYTEFIRGEREAEALKDFLSSKLKSYAGVSHNELEMLCAMGLIWEGNNNADS